jgi:hypothetical protein
MNRIDDLLNRYFEGLSTLEEEKALKTYFLVDSVNPEHEIYSPLFAAFAAEKEIKAPDAILPVAKRDAKKMPLIRPAIRLVLSGVAAALLLLFALHTTGKSRDKEAVVVILNGQRMTDPLAAKEYAGMKFAEVEAAVEAYYKPFWEAEKMSCEMNVTKIFEKVEHELYIPEWQ